MYEAFFHLDRRPFVASPRTDHYFPARSIEQARQSLTRCVSRCEGPGAIIGPSGTGKSLLCFVLAKQFRDKMKVVVVQGGRLRTRKSLLQNVLYELKQPFRDMDEDELRLSLLGYLEAKDSTHKRLLLIVDDAHLLRGQVLLDIAALCSHVRDGEPVIQFVLAGGPALEEKLAHPRLESLQQRIAARCYLQSLSYDETVSYIRAQIENCGGQLDQVVAPDAINALYRASDGVPRLINQVGDHALLLSYLAKLHPVTKAAIEESWSDLQQLPTPWQVTDHPAAVAAKDETTSIIEFGSLDELGPNELKTIESPIPTPIPIQHVEPIVQLNPAFSAEQNLWTIESGISHLHKLSTMPPAAGADQEEPQFEANTILGWGDFEETELTDSTPLDASLTDTLPNNLLIPGDDSSMPSFAKSSIPLKVPASATPVSMPSVKLATPPVHKRVANPFEEQFEVEEVINDGAARKAKSLKMIPATAAPNVTRTAAPFETSKVAPAAIFDEPLEASEGMSVDWLNYQATSVVGMGVTESVSLDGSGSESWNVISSDGTSAVAAGGRYDDRDTLLVENDQPPRIRPVKRQEFRQLFAKMRGES